MRALLRLFRALGPAFEHAHLRWALREIPPTHPDVAFIVIRIAELESRQ